MVTRLSAVVHALLFVLAAIATEATAGPELEFGPAEECPPCVDLFARLEAGSDGRLSQVVEMQQRGEPKSGTSMMGHWADAALDETCAFLSSMYGNETCTVTRTTEAAGELTQLLFNPQLSPADSACSCDVIDR